MNNIGKKILISIICILTLMILTTVILIILLNKDENLIVDSGPQDTIIDETALSKLNSYIIFDLEKVINSYFMNIKLKNEEEIYNVLSKKYKGSSITLSNVLDNVKIEYSEFLIQEVYASQDNSNGKYYIYGLGKNDELKTLEDIYFVVDIDYINNTYEITPSSRTLFLKAKEGRAEKLENTRITKNNNNSISISNVTTDFVIRKYLYDYINKVNFNIEKAYECLDESFKKEKYNTIDKFKSYIEQNKKTKEYIQIDSYNKIINENGMEYDIIDNSGINYKIISKSLMDYRIIIK